VGVVGTGDMGSAVGRVLRRTGLRVITALDERSVASRALAAAAGLEDCGSLERVLDECDLFLSILPPSDAPALAGRAAAHLESSPKPVVFADCNAVAPETVVRIAAMFARGPARFVDVGIVGPAPKIGTVNPTRFYVAGADKQSLLDLRVPEIAMIDMGDRVGQASAIKMCYAAMNKGVDALYTNILLAARRLGVYEPLWREFESSQAEGAARMSARIPVLAATAARYVGEMREISGAFGAAGVSEEFHRGAEWVYALLARSALSSETRATVPRDRTLDEALAAFEAVLAAGSKA